jgi:hypothetical protein
MQTKERIKLSLWNIPLDYRLKSTKLKKRNVKIESKETEKEVD